MQGEDAQSNRNLQLACVFGHADLIGQRKRTRWNAEDLDQTNALQFKANVLKLPNPSTYPAPGALPGWHLPQSHS